VLRLADPAVIRPARDGNLRARGNESQMARVMVGLMPGFVLQALLLGKIDGEGYCDGFEYLTAH
jgi:hypothetical protein